MFSVQFFCILLIADSLDLTGQTDFFEFHILYSVHYNSVITIRTNECTQFYWDRDIITTNRLLHVAGLIGPSSGSPRFYKNSCLTFSACNRRCRLLPYSTALKHLYTNQERCEVLTGYLSYGCRPGDDWANTWHWADRSTVFFSSRNQ